MKFKQCWGFCWCFCQGKSKRQHWSRVYIFLHQKRQLEKAEIISFRWHDDGLFFMSLRQKKLFCIIYRHCHVWLKKATWGNIFWGKEGKSHVLRGIDDIICQRCHFLQLLFVFIQQGKKQTSSSGNLFFSPPAHARRHTHQPLLCSAAAVYQLG